MGENGNASNGANVNAMNKPDKADDYRLTHIIQICLVCASVLLTVTAAIVLWSGMGHTQNVVAVVAVFISIYLFAGSHAIAAHWVNKQSHCHEHTPQATQISLSEKTSNALQRRDMKQMMKCMPYRYHQN